MSDETPIEDAIECEICGERKPDVQLRLDPFLYEVYGEKKYRYLCDDCKQTRKDDV